MSSIPVVRQMRRQITLAGGSVAFEVTTEVIDRGDLPFKHLFVIDLGPDREPRSDVIARVATPVDLRRASPAAPLFVRVSSTDLIRIGTETFARIANTVDLTQLPRDRVVAQRQGLPQYLTNAVAVVYTNLVTADAAARQIVDRLSALVEEWRQFNSDFATNPYQDYDLPALGTSVESARTEVYNSRRTERLAAETARDAAEEAHATCERDCGPDKTIYDFLVVDVAFLERAASLVRDHEHETYVTPGGCSIAPGILTPAGPFTVTTNSSWARNFVLNSAEPDSYAAILLRKRALLAEYTLRVQTCATNCAALRSAVLSAQQVVDAAKDLERAALASVLACCPTFTPGTS